MLTNNPQQIFNFFKIEEAIAFLKSQTNQNRMISIYFSESPQSVMGLGQTDQGPKLLRGISENSNTTKFRDDPSYRLTNERPQPQEKKEKFSNETKGDLNLNKKDSSAEYSKNQRSADKTASNQEREPMKQERISARKGEFINLTKEIEFILLNKECGILERIEKDLKVKCEFENQNLYFDLSTADMKEQIINKLKSIKYIVFEQENLAPFSMFIKEIKKIKEFRELDIFLSLYIKNTFILYTDNENAELKDAIEEIMEWDGFKYDFFRNRSFNYDEELQRHYLEKIIIPNYKNKIEDGKEKEILSISIESAKERSLEDGIIFFLKSKIQAQNEIVWKLKNTFKDLIQISFSATLIDIIQKITSIYIGNNNKEIELNFVYIDVPPNGQNKTRFLYIFGDKDSIINHFFEASWPERLPRNKIFSKIKIEQGNLSLFETQEMKTKLDKYLHDSVIAKLLNPAQTSDKKYVQFDIYLDDIPRILDSLFLKNSGQRKGNEEMQMDKNDHQSKNQNYNQKNKKQLNHSSAPFENKKISKSELDQIFQIGMLVTLLRNDNEKVPLWKDKSLDKFTEKILVYLKKIFKFDSIEGSLIEEYAWNYISEKFSNNLPRGNLTDILLLSIAKPLDGTDNLIDFFAKTDEHTFECEIRSIIFELEGDSEKLKKIDPSLFFSKKHNKYIFFIFLHVKELESILDNCIRPLYKISFSEK